MSDPQPCLLAELARVKVLFQARALAAAMGFPQPDHIGDANDMVPLPRKAHDEHD